MLNFFGLERVNSFHSKKCYNCLGRKGLTGLTFSSPSKFKHMKNGIKSMMPNGITGLERVKSFEVFLHMYRLRNLCVQRQSTRTLLNTAGCHNVTEHKYILKKYIGNKIS
jgi:hypothetical protein